MSGGGLREFEDAIIGSGGPRLVATDQTITHVVVGGAATTGYRVDSDGQAYQRGDGTGGGYTAIQNWVTPTSAVASYDVRGTFGTPTNGGTTSGPAGFNVCTADRTFEFSRNNADSEVTLTVDWVRTGTTSPILRTALITLQPSGSP